MTIIIGIDPGPIVGAVLLRPPITAGRPDAWHVEFGQISANGLWSLLSGWAEAYTVDGLAAERFVIGRLTPRVNAPKATRAALDVLAGLRQAQGRGGTRLIERSASEVKPWATDQRLDAIGLLEPSKGMRHARDAARHALYAACRDFGARDPLSKRAGASA